MATEKLEKAKKMIKKIEECKKHLEAVNNEEDRYKRRSLRFVKSYDNFDVKSEKLYCDILPIELDVFMDLYRRKVTQRIAELEKEFDEL